MNTSATLALLLTITHASATLGAHSIAERIAMIRSDIAWNRLPKQEPDYARQASPPPGSVALPAPRDGFPLNRRILTVAIEQSREREQAPERPRPLLSDTYLSREYTQLFRSLSQQLRAGHLTGEFRRPVLIYGPPGVAKTHTMEALANDSNCILLSATGPYLVSAYRGSAGANIENLFILAREAREQGKGVLVCIHELESILAPPGYSRWEDDNAMLELQQQLERCYRLPECDHICFVATSDQYAGYPSGLRRLFRPVHLQEPDYEATGKILEKFAQEFEVDREAVLTYQAKVTGWCGHTLRRFVGDVAGRIHSEGMDAEEALEQSYRRSCEHWQRTQPPRNQFWTRCIARARKGAIVVIVALGARKVYILYKKSDMDTPEKAEESLKKQSPDEDHCIAQ